MACLAILRGKSQSDAYRQAYNCVRMSDVSVHAEASRLMTNPRVTYRIKELEAPAIVKSR